MNSQVPRTVPQLPMPVDAPVWYAYRPEIRSQALSSGDLSRLVQSGQLYPTDLVWREGWQDWQPAHLVSGLFAPPIPASIALAAAPQPATAGHAGKLSVKDRARHELQAYFVITLYVWAVLALFRLHASLLAATYNVDIESHGLLIIQALILGKVVLIGEALSLGERASRILPIAPALVKSVLFSAAIIAFQIVEHFARELWKGQPPSGGLPPELGGDLLRLATFSALLVLAFLPYFAIREIEKKTGTSDLLLWAIGLKR